jgi:hypothetical protein
VTVPARQIQGDIIESVIAKGDLAKLTPDQRNTYYREVCRSIGLNPLTQPFEYITLNGKLRLYAKRDAADQLRKLNGISIEIVSQEKADGLLTIHVRAKDSAGRADEDLGSVAFPDTLKGEARANAILKCVTKAKRRVTLSISGLGFLDETEVEDMPAAARRPTAPAPNVMLPHDPDTGEIIEPSAAAAEEPAPSHEPSVPHSLTDSSAIESGAGNNSELDRWMWGLAKAAERGEEAFRAAWKEVPLVYKRGLAEFKNSLKERMASP